MTTDEVLLPAGFTARRHPSGADPSAAGGGDDWVTDLGRAGLELAPGELLAAATAGVDADGNLLFLVRADGRLAPVTRSGPPEPEPGDTRILLGRPLPPPVIRCG